MNRIVVVVAVALVAASLATAASAAQESVIYSGDLKAGPPGLTLGSWGSGALQEVSEVQFQTGSVLKLTTQGNYQGGRLYLQTPLDISGFASQPNGYIEMQLRPFYAKPQPKPAEAASGTARPQSTAPGAAARGTTGATRSGLRIGMGGSRRTSGTGVPGTTSRSGGISGASRTRSFGGLSSGGAYGPTGNLGATGSTRGSRWSVGQPGGAYGGGGYAPGAYGSAGYGTRGAYGGSGAYGSTAPYGRAGTGALGGRRGSTAYGTPGQYGRGGYTAQRPRKTQPETATKPETLAQTTPAAPSEAAFRADAFRVEITTDKGTAVLPAYSVYPGNSEAPGWVRVGFPLSQFKGAIGDKLTRITIFGDRPDTVYIGEVKLALETAQLDARPAAYPANTKVGEPVTFLANAHAGLSPVQAVWDFGQVSGGQPPVGGERVVNVFNQPGEYEVRVTVSDTAAASPETKTFAVLVRVR